jgi:uncharacterized protein
MRHLNTLDWVAFVILVIGGITWGLVGLFGFNLISAIFGEASAISRVFFVLVGISAIYYAVISTTLNRGRLEECYPATTTAESVVR